MTLISASAPYHCFDAFSGPTSFLLRFLILIPVLRLVFTGINIVTILSATNKPHSYWRIDAEREQTNQLVHERQFGLHDGDSRIPAVFLRFHI